MLDLNVGWAGISVLLRRNVSIDLLALIIVPATPYAAMGRR